MTVLTENPKGYPVDEKWLEELVRAALTVHGAIPDAQVSLTLTDDEGIRELNREFRGVDASTDVLSFPLLDYGEDYDEEDTDEVWEEDDVDRDPETGEVLLGDIVLSMETAERQAEEFGHGLQREVGYLIVHSMMHLLGYDHEEEEDKRIMRDMEEKALSLVGLTRDEDGAEEEEEEPYYSGFVAVVGRPNVGKSTLINRIVGEKVSIVSAKPQTTRNAIRGVLQEEDCQIVFVDTPGLIKARNRLGDYMVSSVGHALEETDAVLALFDATAPFGGGDKALLELLGRQKDLPVYAVLNKIDRIPDKAQLLEKIAFLGEYPFLKAILPVSASTGEGLDELLEEIHTVIPEGPPYFPEDMYTDQTERTMIAEIIREKALRNLGEEIPHGIGVEIVRMKTRPGGHITDIHADLYVEKASHKGIVLGKGGSMLRLIGSQAREDIEELIQGHVNLQIWVRVKEGWRDSPAALKALGYTEDE